MMKQFFKITDYRLIFISLLMFFFNKILIIEEDLSNAKEYCNVYHRFGCDDNIQAFAIGDTIRIHDFEYIPLNCEGELLVNRYYPNGALLCKEYYNGEMKNIDISYFDPKKAREYTVPQEYFEKKPTGIWKYYNEYGNVIGNINFNKKALRNKTTNMNKGEKLFSSEEKCEVDYIVGCVYKGVSIGGSIRTMEEEYSFLSCDGHMSINKFSGEHLYSKEYYAGNLKERTRVAIDIHTMQEVEEVSKHYEKTPIGEWEFFNEKGNCIGKINF